jgi:hypothetical protein
MQVHHMLAEVAAAVFTGEVELLLLHQGNYQHLLHQGVYLQLKDQQPTMKKMMMMTTALEWILEVVCRVKTMMSSLQWPVERANKLHLPIKAVVH